jgi:uncharacterized membrane protein
MKKAGLILVLFLAGCGGSLSDEQRKHMREEMELHKIVRVTEIEITEAAFTKGREIIKLLEQIKGDSTRLDSLLNSNRGAIRYVRPGASNAKALEKQLIDAYLAAGSGALQDNVQEVRNAEGGYDTLLYTKPVTTRLADGSDRLEGIWNIVLPKKPIILDIGRKK